MYVKKYIVQVKGQIKYKKSAAKGPLQNAGGFII